VYKRCSNATIDGLQQYELCLQQLLMRLRYSKKLGLTSAFKPFGFCALFLLAQATWSPKT